MRNTVSRSWVDNTNISTKDIAKGESVNGVETAKEDNQAIKEFPQPTTRTELRRFIHLAPSFKRSSEP